MAEHLTDAAIKRLPTPETGNKVHYDDAVRGFGCRVTANGHRSFILNYRTKSGRERRITIGATANWQVAAARAEAKKLKQVIDQGGDPLGEIESARSAPSMAELCDRFIEEHVSRKRANTARAYGLLLRLYVRPQLGSKRVSEVSFSDIDALHRKVTKAGRPAQANRLVAMLGRMFTLAIRWQLRMDNPCKGVERNVEHLRRRYLTPDELARLTAALANAPDQQAANAIRLALLTGARSGEVLTARWADIDLTAGTWSKPPSSTKQKRAHTVPLAGPARQLLAEIARQQAGEQGEFVFPGNGQTGHLRNIKHLWYRLCRDAKLTDLRLHDLRHSYASQLVSSGASLVLVGSLLGHSQAQTTLRYAHLFDDTQREAVEKVGAIIEAAGKPAPPESVRSPSRKR
jgi:integrase